MAARALRCVALVLLCTCQLAAQSARADAAQLPAYVQLEQRVSLELTESLTHEASRAFAWRLTWTAINGAVAAASIAGLWVLPRSEQPSLIVGAISSGVSALLTWIWPLEVESDAQSAEQATAVSGGAHHARLRALYTHSAQDESDRIQWPWHIITLVTALIPATILWAGYRQFVNGTISLATGIVLGEAALLTQPTRLHDRPMPGALQLGFTGRDMTVHCRFVW
jgi:hypothetical protein